MSYASDMKKELTLIEITQDREFLSELSALIKMNGILTIANGRLSLSFQTENASIARRMYSLIKYFYKVHINISVRKKLKLKKNNVYICRLDQDVKAILTDLYILNDDYTMRLDIAEELIDTEEKKKAYLRGAFLAGGSINNPRTSSYHMEIFSYYEEHNKELMEHCQVLKEYAQYVARVRQYTSLQELSLEEAVERAVDECINEGILAEFLTRNRAEVVSVSIFEYDKEKEEKKLRKAEFESGVETGIQRGKIQERNTNIREMLLDNVPVEKIKQYTKASDKEILDIQKLMNSTTTKK